MQTDIPKPLMDDIRSAQEDGARIKDFLDLWRDNPNDFRFQFVMSMIGYAMMAIAVGHTFGGDGLLFLVGLVLNYSMKRPR
jgi:hypothetical protein